MITKKFGVDFTSDGGALTLDVEEVTKPGSDTNVQYYKTHPDGWKITAYINEDYYEWINYFEAKHLIYGDVWGDFQYIVFADSEEAFQHFYKNHPPHAWDYGDI